MLCILYRYNIIIIIISILLILRRRSLAGYLYLICSAGIRSFNRLFCFYAILYGPLPTYKPFRFLFSFRSIIRLLLTFFRRFVVFRPKLCARSLHGPLVDFHSSNPPTVTTTYKFHGGGERLVLLGRSRRVCIEVRTSARKSLFACTVSVAHCAHTSH